MRRPYPRRWRRSPALLILAALPLVPALTDLALGAVRPLRMGEETCRVVSVVDGDTLKLFCPGEGLFTARLLGFDTPELFSPGCVSEWLRAAEAGIALRLLLLRAGERSGESGGQDRYGRTLVTLTLDGAPLAETMVARGLARPYEGGRRAGWCSS